MARHRRLSELENDAPSADVGVISALFCTRLYHRRQFVPIVFIVPGGDVTAVRFLV